jgi:hypothetical protein
MPALSFLRKSGEIMRRFGIYSSSNLPILVRTTATVMPCLSQVRNVGVAGGEGKAFMSCVLIVRVGEW